MECPTCGAHLPADARFCIECGADLQRPANTGATVSLPHAAEGAVICRACGISNPNYALFCVRCGQRIEAARASYAPSRPQPPVIDMEPSQGLAPRPQTRPFAMWNLWLPIFLVGMGLLLLLRMPIWPLMLLVLGVANFVSESLRGRLLSGIQSAFFLFGLTFLFSAGPRFFVPGMIVLVGGSILFGLLAKATQKP